ncbi:Hypothetical protein BN69_3637 [Methylocystis sp. SC2]|nr:Hypothetical protein BN69_3637 [Methylocystis sp. SC2]
MTQSGEWLVHSSPSLLRLPLPRIGRLHDMGAATDESNFFGPYFVSKFKLNLFLHPSRGRNVWLSTLGRGFIFVSSSRVSACIFAHMR